MTCLTALKDVALTTEASVIMAQEIHILGEALIVATGWFKRHGWNAALIEAKAGATPESSKGGVGILVRNQPGFGLSPPPGGDHTIYPARLCAATIESPGDPKFVAYSGYLYASEGLSSRNKRIMEAQGRHVLSHGMPWIWGADFNNPPQAIIASPYVELTGAWIMHTDPGVGTCTHAGTPTTIDYFACSKDMANGVESIEVILNTRTKPHRAVMLTFRPNLLSLKALVFKTPPPLKTEATIGPRQAGPCWDAAKRAALWAKECCSKGDRQVSDKALEYSYKIFANTAEVSIARATDTCLAVYGRRGETPISYVEKRLPTRGFVQL